MSYRLRKQLIIVLIVLLVLGLIGFGVYWQYFRHIPTCFDKIQNQGEEDVDCGGPCIPCERLTIRDLQVQWAKFLPLAADTVDLAAYISNPNPNYGLAQFDYTFKLYDSAGRLVKEQPGQSYILPNQKKYLIEGSVVADQKVSLVELEIATSSKEIWKKTNSDYQLPQLSVSNKQFQFLDNPPGASQASGIIKNNSAFDFDTISVSIILYDDAQEIIGVNKTQARTVMANEERYFSALWYTPINRDRLNSMDVYVETNLLLDANFMSKYGIQEKFQEYPTATK